MTDILQFGEKMYGIKRQEDADPSQGDGEGDGPEDIEASIQKELRDLKESKTKPKEDRVFTIVPADVECVLFVKTTSPVQPTELVRQICIDARDATDVMQRKSKYVNRLTPVTRIDKATEKRLARTARAAMAPHFRLVEEDGPTESAESADAEEKLPKPDADSPNFSVGSYPRPF